MMKKSDQLVLEKMRSLLTRELSGDLAQLVERLLELRDKLDFQDSEWFHEVTQHIATLDSASTFTPSNEKESEQAKNAILQAANQITYLIDLELS